MQYQSVDQMASLQWYLRKLPDGQRFLNNVMDHLRCRYRSLKRHRDGANHYTLRSQHWRASTPISEVITNWKSLPNYFTLCFSLTILSSCVLKRNVAQTCRGFHHPFSQMSVVIGSARAIVLIRIRMFLEHHLVKARLHISRLIVEVLSWNPEGA